MLAAGLWTKRERCGNAPPKTGATGISNEAAATEAGELGGAQKDVFLP